MGTTSSASQALVVAAASLVLAACGPGSGAGEAPPSHASGPTPAAATSQPTTSEPATSPPATTSGGARSPTAGKPIPPSGAGSSSAGPTPSSSRSSSTSTSTPSDSTDDGDLSDGDHPDGLFLSTPSITCLYPTPSAELPFEVVDRPGTVCFSFSGFPNQASPIKVTMTGPAGTRTEKVVRENDAWTWVLHVGLALPLGEYTVIGEQEPSTVTADAKIDVRLARQKTVQVVAQRGPSGGPGLRVELGGFPPQSAPNAFLYGPAQPQIFPFNRALPRAHVGPIGEGAYSVDADPTLAPGTYLVSIDGRAAPCDPLCPTFTVPGLSMP